jgi:hypothetical protein
MGACRVTRRPWPRYASPGWLTAYALGGAGWAAIALIGGGTAALVIAGVGAWLVFVAVAALTGGGR